jgi:hypothetical protein
MQGRVGWSWSSLEISDPKSGDEIQQLLGESYGGSGEAIAAARSAMTEGKNGIHSDDRH